MADETKDPKGMSADALIDAILHVGHDRDEADKAQVEHDAAVVLELRRRLEAYETAKAEGPETIAKCVGWLLASVWHARYGRTMTEAEMARMAETLRAFLASGA